MNAKTSSIFLILVSLILSSCATPVSRTGLGLLYTDHFEGTMVTANPAGRKRGQACTQNYLGLVTSGDGTVSAAMKDGAITVVSSVDHSYTGFLGLYGKVCTIVTGN